MLNLRKVWVVSGTAVAVPAVITGIVFGVFAAINANDTAQRHTGQNMTYIINDCSVGPGKHGTQWQAAVTTHNGNGNDADGYGVQVEFFQNGVGQGWSKVVDLPDLSAGATDTENLTATANQSASADVTCKVIFYFDGSPAGSFSPVPQR